MIDFVATQSFSDDLKRLDVPIRKRIKEKLLSLTASENPLLYARKMKGYKDLFRFRIGDYRVIVQYTKLQIILLNVKHRKEIYEGL